MTGKKFRPQMTDSERVRGFVFFALYLTVFPYLNGWVQRRWANMGEVPVAEANLIYYALLFVLAVLVFWTFLRHGFDLLVDWLPENAFALFTGLVGAWVLHLLVSFLPLPVENPIPLQWREEYLLSPGVTLLLVVVLMPFIEEVLFRGLLFGSLRRRGRATAYVVTVLLFALSGVWRYALEAGNPAYLLLTILYLPKALALCWCYDNGGSIWSTVALHMALNGIQLFLALH